MFELFKIRSVFNNSRKISERRPKRPDTADPRLIFRLTAATTLANGPICWVLLSSQAFLLLLTSTEVDHVLEMTPLSLKIEHFPVGPMGHGGVSHVLSRLLDISDQDVDALRLTF